MSTGLGIDAGAQWIKAVQVRCSGDRVLVTGALRLPRPGAKPPGAEEDEAEHSGAVLVPPTLGAELARAGLRSRGTAGITGRDLMYKYISTPPLPLEKLRMFMELQAADRLLPGRKSEGAPAVTYDFRILNVPGGLKSDMMLLAAVGRNEFLHGAFATFRAARVQLHRLVPSAMALAQAYLCTRKTETVETVVLADVGHELVETAVVRDKDVYFLRSGPGGGRKFDAALDKVMKLGPKVQEFKHARARLYAENERVPSPVEQQQQTALREAADGLVQVIRQSVMLCRTQAKVGNLDFQRVILSGGGARLRGLREHLEKKLQRPVGFLDLSSALELRRLDAQSAKCFEEEATDMAVAFGLAVLDAQPQLFQLSLVPEKIVRQQVFRQKTLWGAAAGVVLLASLFFPFLQAREAARQAKDREELFQSWVSDARKRREDFKKDVAAAEGRNQKARYYARQVRLGPALLDLFIKLRECAPAGMTLTGIGPRDEQGGETTLGARAFTEDQCQWLVKGYFDTEKVPEAEIPAKANEFFGKLSVIPGLKEVPSFREDPENSVQGARAFFIQVNFHPPDAPYVPGKPAPPATGPAVAPPPPPTTAPERIETAPPPATVRPPETSSPATAKKGTGSEGAIF